MTAFPDLLTGARPVNPFSESIEFRTLGSEYEGGESVTKQKWLFPKRSFPLKYKNITTANARTLWQFFMGRKGKHLPFNVFLPWASPYTGEYVGTGTGTTAIYNLPSMLASGYTVYVGGAEQTGGGVDYTFTAAGGEDGADKITFTTPPAAGRRGLHHLRFLWPPQGALQVRRRPDELRHLLQPAGHHRPYPQGPAQCLTSIRA